MTAPRRLFRRLVALALAAACLPNLAIAGEKQRPPIRIAVRAGPLSRAIAQIAAQSGASIGTDHPDWLRRPVAPMVLTGTVETVLAQVLRGTGLIAMRTGPLGWRVIAAPPELPRKPRRSSSPLPPVPSAETSDILVTGSKVAIELSDFPGTVEVIEAAQLDRMPRNQGTLALAALHSTLSSTRLGPGRNKLFLRSIADSSFNGSSPALVGQYLNDLRLTYASPDPDLRLHDIRQVEILEGPQGTLYGAGSLGGILRIVPRAPEPSAFEGATWSGLSATAHGGMGSDGGFLANLPLTESAALRTVAYAEHNAGFIDDVRRRQHNVNASDVVGLRTALRLETQGGWQIDLTAMGQNIRNADAQYAEGNIGRLSRASAVAQPSFHRYRALSSLVKHDFGGANLQSTTGLIRQHYGQVFDATQPGDDPIRFEQRDHVSLISNETHLSGRTTTGASWLLGVAALRSESREVRGLGSDDDMASLGTIQSRVTEGTAFGEFGIPLSRAWKFTVGGRISAVTLGGRARGPIAKPVDGALPNSGQASWQWLATPSLALDWQAIRGLSLYLRHAGGYRPGGLTIGAVLERFSPDRIATTELGLRYTCHCTVRLHLEGSVSSSRWTNVQADLLDGLGLPHVANIGDGRVETATAAASLSPLAGLEITASGFTSHSYLKSSEESIGGVTEGPLPNVARYGLTGSVRGQWKLAKTTLLDLALRGHAVGPSILGVGPQLAHRQGDYRTVSADARLSLRGLVLNFSVENLFDAKGNLFALGTPFTIATGRQRTPLQPRTARLGVEMRY